MKQIDSTVFDAKCINVHRTTHFDSEGIPYYETVLSVVNDNGNTIMSVYSGDYIVFRQSGDTMTIEDLAGIASLGIEKVV